ncbi:helix-turn-helix domain-containing protein [Cloacibacillus evryensis]|uniref:helix-turn-helix domain-containing protein n=1 Tax=Cloacibacillus evryensis TaxID=508460 RepID=UPI000686FB8E|nr:helix-turn-helix domain-containing protein [Cloacibacillus evryensis]
MTKKEVRRVEVLSIALSGGLTNKDASELLGVCVRQFIRIKKKFLQEGAQGLVHGNRGRNPVHAITDEVRGEVVSLLRKGIMTLISLILPNILMKGNVSVSAGRRCLVF